MVTTDPIADMLTRIRNANQQKHETVSIPYSNLKNDLAKILKNEGFVTDFVVNEEGKLNGMELNRRIGNDIIAGPFFICGDSDDGEFISLTDEQMDVFASEFKDAPVFTGDEPEAQPRMIVTSFNY